MQFLYGDNSCLKVVCYRVHTWLWSDTSGLYLVVVTWVGQNVIHTNL